MFTIYGKMKKIIFKNKFLKTNKALKGIN